MGERGSGSGAIAERCSRWQVRDEPMRRQTRGCQPGGRGGRFANVKSPMLYFGVMLPERHFGWRRAQFPEGQMIQSAVVQQLRQGGVRVTPQRLAIAEAVLNSTDHPTVQQIHERVQQHFPSMTLATVYSTLGVLSKSGLIQELPFAKQSRYESNVSPHVNLVCVGCGNIADADDSSDIIIRLRDQVSTETRFQVMWQRVDFHGWCRSCLAEAQSAPATEGQ